MEELSSAWNPAPLVLVGAGLTLLLFLRGWLRLRVRGRTDHAGWSRLALFALALALGTLPLVSPLDEVGDSYLLSGHMLQHVLIGDAAAALALVALRGPLCFFVLPGSVLRSLSRRQPIRRLLAFVLRPSVSLVAWMVVIAAWHVPAAYDYALTHENVHHLEHLSFILVGLLVWMQIVDPARRRQLRLSQRVWYMVALFAAGAALAGTLVLATRPLYPAYASDSVRLFGISPLRDQQLAGYVMLVQQALTFGLCASFWTRGLAHAAHGDKRMKIPATEAAARS